jgi:putative transposase
MQNGQVESFNGRVRDELLNPNCYPDLFTARAAAAEWLIDYNDLRPHSALGYLTPAEFIKSFSNQRTQHLSAA